MRAILPTGWHHTFPISRGGHGGHGGHGCLSCFQSKPKHKHPHFHVHAGQLRLWLGDVIPTEVIVFQSQAEQRARRLTTGLRHMQALIDRRPDLKKSVAVVQTHTQSVESLDYFPGQRKTVQKGDTVVVQELAAGRSDVIVDYDDTFDDVAQLGQEHPVLAELVEHSRRSSRDRRVVSYLRAVLVAEVYHLTFVTFHCGADEGSGGRGQSRRQSQGDVTAREEDDVDGKPSHSPLMPTAPEALEPTAPEPEALEPTAPEPEALEPTAPEQEALEPTAPGQEDTVTTGVEWDDEPPPPYCESMDSGEGMGRPPPYQRYEDPPPPYQDVL